MGQQAGDNDIISTTKGTTMQNRYAGDIGDYGKLGLLRSLSRTGLRIGVNWYLTPDEHNGDGRHTDYDSFRSCDEELWRKLREIANSDQRSVAALENADLLNAAYYHEVLDLGKTTDRSSVREKWHSDALARLAGSELVFLDPDNGLMVKSAEKTAQANKYVTLKEIEAYCRHGASVIWYQHKARYRDSHYRDQFREILGREEFRNMSGIGLMFTRVSQRYYFILTQPEHRDIIRGQVNGFLESPWKNCFSELK